MPTPAAVFRVFPDLLAALQALLPPWAVPVVLGALALALVPAYRYWSGSRQIKGKLRRYGRARSEADKQRIADEAFAIAARHPRLMVALADEAMRLGMKALMDRAIAHLRETGAAPTDLKRLTGKVTRDKPAPMHPVEEAVHVERMLGEGLLPAARQRLDAALERFPGDEELRALAARLAEAEAEAVAEDADGAAG